VGTGMAMRGFIVCMCPPPISRNIFINNDLASDG